MYHTLRGRFFSENMTHFSHCPKNVPKNYPEKEVLKLCCLESADSNCTAVSEGGKIQTTKLKKLKIVKRNI